MRHLQAHFRQPNLRLLVRCAAALGLVVSAACTTINPYEKNRELLRSATKNLASENSALAAQDAERLYAGRAEQAGQFKLQRYYALYLLTEAHVQAAMHKPFLVSASNAGDAAQSTIGSLHNSDVPHLVAATYYAGLARDMAESVAGEKQVVEGTKLLPAELESISVHNAQVKLELIRLVALSRLGFATSYQREVENRLALMQAESCDELIARVGLEKELVPWLYYTLFQCLKDSKDSVAYLFGARARLMAADMPGSIPPERLAEVIDWVKLKSAKVQFCCQLCRKPFLFEKLHCMDDNTPITTFFAVAR